MVTAYESSVLDRKGPHMTTELATDWGPLSEPIHTEVPDDAPPWRDNAFLIFWDVERGLVGTLHVSTSPNAEGRRMRLSIQFGDKTIELVEDLAPGTFTSDSVTFSAGSDFSVASDRVRGHVSMTPLFAVADYTGDRAPEAFSLDKKQPLAHYQRAATVTGELEIDGQTVPIEGHGFRDRTWGYRDESSSVSEYFGCMFVFDNCSISAMKLRGLGGEPVVLGTFMGDEATFLTSVALTRDASGLFAACDLEFADGRTMTIRGVERRAGFWCPMGWERSGPTLSAFDEFMTVQTGDGEHGFGLIEQGVLKTVF
jgi:hypothetical protein